MPAMFTNTEGEYFVYDSAHEVKERDGQYIVKDGYGSVLGIHNFESISAMTTDPLIIKENIDRAGVDTI